MSNLFLKFKHPFTCMVSGPTSSGKTVFVRRLLNSYKTIFHFEEKKLDKLRVLWAYGQMQNLYSLKISNSVDIKYISGLPNEEELKTYRPNILVIDDLMSDIGDNKNLADLFTRGSHHLGISVILISQNLLHQGKQMRTIGLNCHYYIIMKSVRGKAQLRHFCSDVFPGKTNFLMEAYEDATKHNPYSYIKVDLTQHTDDKYRVSTRITPEEIGESKKSSPIFYVPR